jgi:TolA-binding protein
MNAMMIGESNSSAASRDPADEKMEQIRDLLFGEYQRQSEVRIAQLEMRIRDLESGVQRRLDALQARLEALAGESHAERRSAFDDLARGVQELGERIRQIPRD